MAITIDNAYVESFERNIRMVAQQGESKLRGFVNEVQDNSEAHNWDILGAATARAKTAARMVSPAGGNGSGAVDSTDQLAFTRRKTLVATYDVGEVIEIEDPAQMLSDPNAPITRTLGSAIKRKFDDIIIAAATGTALDGDGSGVSFLSTQTVGSSATILTMDTLLETQQLFLENDVDPDEEKVLIISPVQYRTLMNIEELTSSDYMSLKALATGYLPNFLGFHHIVLSNRLTAPASGQIACVAFTRDAIGLHVAKDITARVAERPDMSFAWQFYATMSAGAVRVEDKKVIKIHLKNAQS